MLQLIELSAGFGRQRILHGVSLAVGIRSIAAIIGHNGAGKSVLLKTIAGFADRHAGRILVDGLDVTALSPANRFRGGITYVPQVAIVFPRMTVEENLMMGAIATRGTSAMRDGLARAYGTFPAIAEFRHRPAASLSGGQQRQVALARALMRIPKVVLLDEPSIGLDPKTLAHLRGNIRTLAAEGIAVLLVEQNVRFALSVAEDIHVLSLGKLTFSSDARDMGGRDELLRHYLTGPAGNLAAAPNSHLHAIAGAQVLGQGQ